MTGIDCRQPETNSDEEWNADGQEDIPGLGLNEAPFVSIEEISLLPHWLVDEDLKHSHTETLPLPEEQFWRDMIDKYLLPIEPTEEEKVQ